MDYLLIDKYHPHDYTQLFFNHDVCQSLCHLGRQAQDLPHLILKGYLGSGRKTLVELLIKTQFHIDNLNLQFQQVNIKHSTKIITINIISCLYYQQINPSLNGVYDRFIIKDYISTVIRNKPINQLPYHLMVIEDADKLSLEAQQSLRRTMEKYINHVRFIFLTNLESELIAPLSSRCVKFNLKSPTLTEIVDLLIHICQCEHITYHPVCLYQIAEYSQRQTKTALNLLQKIYLQSPQSLQHSHHLLNINQFYDVEQIVDNIVHLLTHQLTSLTIVTGRQYLYDLLVHCLPPIDIMKKIFWRLMTLPSISQDLQSKLITILNQSEYQLKMGSKPIYHLEGYLINIGNSFGKV